MTTSIFHKTVSAANWLYPHPLNFRFANYQIMFFLAQDQCQITGLWFCWPFTWKYWQHMNIFSLNCRSASTAIRQRKTVLLWHIMGHWEVWHSWTSLSFELSLPTSIWLMVIQMRSTFELPHLEVYFLWHNSRKKSLQILQKYFGEGCQVSLQWQPTFKYHPPSPSTN